MVAVGDPALHAEAIHIAAATGRQVIDAADDAQLARHAPKALALLIDDLRAPSLGTHPRGPNVFTVVEDTASTALREDCYALPAQAVDVLRGDLNDSADGAPPQLRTDLLKLHQLAMAAFNEGSRSRVAELFDLAVDLQDQVDHLMTSLEQVQETLSRLTALYPESLS